MKTKYLIFLIANFTFAIDYQTEIQPIFDNNCGNCHLGNSSGDLNLSNYDNLMSSGTVIPGNALGSSLYDRIIRDNAEAGDMPPGNAELSQSEINLIADWINEGALPEESLDVEGCTDSNAITCDDLLEDDSEDFTLYFPDCETCSDDIPCENYYNPEAVVDNGSCMYNIVPTSNEFLMDYFDTSINFTSGFNLDWSAFTPPVDVIQYVLQRCVDNDGDTDGDGELEYENCIMVITPGTFYLESTYTDEFEVLDASTVKYSFYVHYPNNNYWGSANGYYYYSSETGCDLGDVTGDGLLNVLDIVNLVNYIFGAGDFTDEQLCAADLNEDSIINVLDIVNLVNLILS